MAACDQTTCDDLQDQINDLGDRMTTAENAITALQADVADLQTRVAILEEWRSTYVDPTLLDHEGRISALEDADAGLLGAFRTLVDILFSKKVITTVEQIRVLTPILFPEELPILPEEPIPLLVGKPGPT